MHFNTTLQVQKQQRRLEAAQTRGAHCTIRQQNLKDCKTQIVRDVTEKAQPGGSQTSDITGIVDSTIRCVEDVRKCYPALFNLH